METYEVVFYPDFVEEFRELDIAVKEALGEVFDLLRDVGPKLGRPNVNTLKNSRHDNMKEIRVDAGGGCWRVAFAFDPGRQAIIICGGDKSGVGERRFYDRLIHNADNRFDLWLAAG
ncbi:type II toxin-antitoxin system RelE/ParE family toxin [uncultured Devosia sp.]|uniref:type II toxin-antitoxin system RelE/ParE family toxin n=1 Tax=uncultured Devosia sp. TaxID=211434 RepID=UPI0035CAB8E6